MNPKLTLLILCALTASALNLPVLAQSALTVSGSAYTESGTTHSTGDINTAGAYTGTGVRFTGTLTVRDGSGFTVDTGTLAAISGSNAAAVSLQNSTASTATLLETGLLSLDHSVITGAVNHRNTAAVSGTLLLNSSTINTYTGSNTVFVQITDSRINGTATITNLSGQPGAVAIENSTFGDLLLVNSFTLALTSATNTGNTFRRLYLRGDSALVIDRTTVNGSVRVENQSALRLDDSSVIGSTGLNENAAIMLSNTSSGVINSATLRPGSNAWNSGIVATNGSEFVARDIDILTTGNYSMGIEVNAGSSGTVIGAHIVTTQDVPNAAYANGVFARNNSRLDMTGFTIQSAAEGIVVQQGSTVILNSGTIRADEFGYQIPGNSANTLHARDVQVESVNAALYIRSDRTDIRIEGGLLSSATAASFSLETTGSGGNTVVFTDGVTFANSGTAMMLTSATTYAAADQIRVENGVTVDGDIVANGSINAVLAISDHSTIAGNLIAGEDAVLIITGSNGATISGDVTGSEHAVIDLTLSGSASSLTGDITRNAATSVTVTLDHGATGSGGFTGGHLSVGGDSEWDFTKDSAANHIDNHGTILLGTTGNYIALRSDTISGDGTWYFPIDSDTGAKSTVTGSTAADNHPRGIITATGDGQRDPNTVANTLVTGENKENWHWDNFSWGLDEYTQDGHDADGNPHFTQLGTSPVGTVLNSAIAIQQSMWFAQQDSLLKRMGELRYGARASRPPAGGTPAFHNLIDNLWLRNYGQQLNVGSQVSGKAYEQLIYGVDLGTDHKFTISADSDLYLGVYAGYGRSDLDYRTPGADGEINSYYGGLYAIWLHSSGFYIDATFKAASVDNDLKAPYGNTQLKANYSDVNVGGSLEIGKKFTFQDGWFVEPQFQVNYLHILAEDYTAGPMSITTQDLDALQLRIGSLFGRTINLTNGGALQPYVKISGVETISNGGAIRNGYQSARANTDGARAELGAGLIWQLDTNNQLHLDYEASFGDKYDKPWGLSAGYRHQF